MNLDRAAILHELAAASDAFERDQVAQAAYHARVAALLLTGSPASAIGGHQAAAPETV